MTFKTGREPNPFQNILNDSVKFSFLGDRKYIDITTINESILESLKKMGLIRFNTFRLRVLSPITMDGLLSVSQDVSQKQAPPGTVVQLEFLHVETKYYGWVLPAELSIQRRRNEVHYIMNDYVKIEEKSILLLKPFNKDLVYNLMKMGKELVVKSEIGQNPRVAEFAFDFFPAESEYVDLKMQLEPMKNYLYCLRCYVQNRVFGRVIVKVLS